MKRTRDEIESDVVEKTREEREYVILYSCEDRQDLGKYICDLEDELVKLISKHEGLICIATNGLFSKAGYPNETVRQVMLEWIDEQANEQTKEQTKELREQIATLKSSLAAQAVELDELNEERHELLEVAHVLWAMLVASGNDDLVLEIETSAGKSTISAEELAGRLRHLGVRVDQPIDLRKWATNE